MPTLATLPPELQASVVAELDGKALLNFRLVCRAFQSIVHDCFRRIGFDHVMVFNTSYALNALVRIIRDREYARTVHQITCVLLRFEELQ